MYSWSPNLSQISLKIPLGKWLFIFSQNWNDRLFGYLNFYLVMQPGKKFHGNIAASMIVLASGVYTGLKTQFQHAPL